MATMSASVRPLSVRRRFRFGGFACCGAADPIAVSGPLAEGTCAIGARLRCDLRYHLAGYAPGVDLAAVARYWQARGDGLVDQRLVVSSLFDSDPLGVLDLPLD